MLAVQTPRRVFYLDLKFQGCASAADGSLWPVCTPWPTIGFSLRSPTLSVSKPIDLHSFGFQVWHNRYAGGKVISYKFQLIKNTVMFVLSLWILGLLLCTLWKRLWNFSVTSFLNIDGFEIPPLKKTPPETKYFRFEICRRELLSRSWAIARDGRADKLVL